MGGRFQNAPPPPQFSPPPPSFMRIRSPPPHSAALAALASCWSRPSLSPTPPPFHPLSRRSRRCIRGSSSSSSSPPRTARLPLCPRCADVRVAPPPPPRGLAGAGPVADAVVTRIPIPAQTAQEVVSQLASLRRARCERGGRTRESHHARGVVVGRTRSERDGRRRGERQPKSEGAFPSLGRAVSRSSRCSKRRPLSPLALGSWGFDEAGASGVGGGAGRRLGCLSGADVTYVTMCPRRQELVEG